MGVYRSGMYGFGARSSFRKKLLILELQIELDQIFSLKKADKIDHDVSI